MSKLEKSAKPRGLRRLFATGFTMGAADLVPGVSGGTIAFLFGIYEELLFSIKTITGKTLRLLLKGKFKEAWQSIPFHFLVPLALGIGLAIFGLATLISYLLDHHGLFVWSFFFGLVAASAFVIRKRVTHWNTGRILAVLAGAILTYLIVGLGTGQLGSSPLMIFVTGMLAFSAMILPGISGSLMMVIMGQYEIVIEAVSDRNVGLLFFLALGGAVGLALLSRLLSWLFKKYYGVVVAFLIGVMLGSLRKVWPWHEQVGGAEHAQRNILPVFDWTFLVCVLLAIAAFVAVLTLEKRGVTREHSEDIGDQTFKKDYKASLRNS